MFIHDSPHQWLIFTKGKCPLLPNIHSVSAHRWLTALIIALRVSTSCRSIAQHLATANSHLVKSHALCLFFYLFKSQGLYLWRLLCLLSWVGNSSCVYNVIPEAIYYFIWHTHQSTYFELGMQAYIYVSWCIHIRICNIYIVIKYRKGTEGQKKRNCFKDRSVKTRKIF